MASASGSKVAILACMAGKMPDADDYTGPVKIQSEKHPMRASRFAKHFVGHLRLINRYAKLTDEQLWEMFFDLVSLDFLDILYDLDMDESIEDPPQPPKTSEECLQMEVEQFFPKMKLFPKPSPQDSGSSGQTGKQKEKDPCGAPWPTKFLFYDQRNANPAPVFTPEEKQEYVRQCGIWVRAMKGTFRDVSYTYLHSKDDLEVPPLGKNYTLHDLEKHILQKQHVEYLKRILAEEAAKAAKWPRGSIITWVKADE